MEYTVFSFFLKEAWIGDSLFEECIVLIHSYVFEGTTSFQLASPLWKPGFSRRPLRLLFNISAKTALRDVILQDILVLLLFKRLANNFSQNIYNLGFQLKLVFFLKLYEGLRKILRQFQRFNSLKEPSNENCYSYHLLPNFIYNLYLFEDHDHLGLKNPIFRSKQSFVVKCSPIAGRFFTLTNQTLTRFPSIMST